jgi:hypothetical protein
LYISSLAVSFRALSKRHISRTCVYRINENFFVFNKVQRMHPFVGKYDENHNFSLFEGIECYYSVHELLILPFFI